MAHPLKEASRDGGTSTSLKFAILSASFTARAFAPLKPAGLPVTFAEWVTASVKG